MRTVPQATAPQALGKRSMAQSGRDFCQKQPLGVAIARFRDLHRAWRGFPCWVIHQRTLPRRGLQGPGPEIATGRVDPFHPHPGSDIHRAAGGGQWGVEIQPEQVWFGQCALIRMGQRGPGGGSKLDSHSSSSIAQRVEGGQLRIRGACGPRLEHGCGLPGAGFDQAATTIQNGRFQPFAANHGNRGVKSVRIVRRLNGDLGAALGTRLGCAGCEACHDQKEHKFWDLGEHVASLPVTNADH